MHNDNVNDQPSASGSSLHVPDSLGASLFRRNSHPSRQSTGLVPSPKSIPTQTSTSSASSSHVSTPRLLSRRNSTRDRSTGMLSRHSSTKRPGRRKSVDEGGSFSPRSDEENVIETPQLRVDRDPETGRKMINQYLVLHEIGHGTHGRVRLGKDLSTELAGEDEDPDGGRYAIKIVDRTSRKKRLAGLSRQRRDGGNMVNESEIRKEIAIFKKVNHPNVVRMKEIIDDPDSSKLFMIMEYCEDGEVRWRTEDGRPALTLEKTRSIFRDTLLGLEYLHHQGIIHRDIKPSNLLMHHGVVKISDFGCSHFSEALRAAATQLEAEQYVDDVDLAKTAGSPAFFAPEMCYSGQEESSHDVVNLDDPLPPRPITNAIDVWALGVTLFCLLFGRTPFDAANEYLLMQVIPHAELQLPSHMSSERLPVSDPSEQVAECLDLLKRLLIKDPTKRISLEQAKHHPFTLRGLPDPSTWLASTDPHVQSYVTVSNDEVAAVVIGSSGFRDKFRKGIRTISNKLQLFSTVGRVRGRSVVEGHASPPAPTSPSGQLASAPRSPIQSSGIARRLSLRRHRHKDIPRPESTAPIRSLSSQDASSSKSPGIYRSLSSQLLQIPRPRPIESTASDAALELHHPLPTSDLAPNLFRRSSDLETTGRRRSESNTGISNKFSRLLSRNNSQTVSRTREPEGVEDHPRDARPSISSVDDASSSSSVRGRSLTSPWESRLKSPTLGLPRPLSGHDESPQEEIDWNETLSDDEDDCAPYAEHVDEEAMEWNGVAPSRGRQSFQDDGDGGLAISVGRSRTVSAARSSQ